MADRLRRVRNGVLSSADASSMADSWYTVELLRFRNAIVDVLTEVLRDHPLPRIDFWPSRALRLDSTASLTPLTIAVWDAGVDTTLFAGRLHVNVGEVPGNGVDDDHNGFVDDIHGAGFEAGGRRTTLLLEPSPLTPGQSDTAALWTRGQSDLLNVVESPDAKAYVGFFRTLSPAALSEAAQRGAIGGVVRPWHRDRGACSVGQSGRTVASAG